MLALGSLGRRIQVCWTGHQRRPRRETCHPSSWHLGQRVTITHLPTRPASSPEALSSTITDWCMDMIPAKATYELLTVRASNATKAFDFAALFTGFTFHALPPLLGRPVGPGGQLEYFLLGVSAPGVDIHHRYVWPDCSYSKALGSQAATHSF